MTDAERREASRQFYNKWRNRGKEDEDDRSDEELCSVRSKRLSAFFVVF